MSTVLADANGVIGSSLGKVSVCAVAIIAKLFFLDASDLEGVWGIHEPPSFLISLLGLKHCVVQVF